MVDDTPKSKDALVAEEVPAPKLKDAVLEVVEGPAPKLKDAVLDTEGAPGKLKSPEELDAARVDGRREEATKRGMERRMIVVY